jgi:DNA-binding NarL/FixJ family response regulator
VHPAETDIVHVVVVDDEPMVCEFLRTILSSTGQITVDAVARDGSAGAEAAARHRPDVVLMDLRMPGTDGVSATARIRELPEPPVVVAMTTFDTDEHVLAALDAGASGFLLKTTPPDRLIPFVLAAAAGASVLSPEAVQRLRRSAVADPAPVQRRHRRAALPERGHGQGPRLPAHGRPRL